ncbi:MAG: 3-oxoacyl-[acyl-carrier-protein] reductase [Thermoanaerobaculales bacterium]
MTEFGDQVAVVTGGARGIGAEIARRLARGGARVVCADVLDTSGIVQEIVGAGGAAEGRKLDVTDGEAAAAVIDAIHSDLGRLDILVNNAGITRDQLLIRMKPEDWDLVLDINLDGVFKVTQPAAKLMMRQRSGRIVNVASVVGLMGNAGQCNYAASKAGLIGFTKSLARELGPRNITVNAVAPGFIQTPMTDKLTDEQRDALIANVSIRRLGMPEDVADAVAFLAGPSASYITGVALNVSGGLYI